MKINLKIIIISIILLIGIIMICFIYYFNPINYKGYETGHPWPKYSEIYEAIDPNSGEAIMRITSTTWTNGRNIDFIMFKQNENNIWYIWADSFNDPNTWAVFHNDIIKENSIQLKKIYQVHLGIEEPAPHSTWSEIDKIIKK